MNQCKRVCALLLCLSLLLSLFAFSASAAEESEFELYNNMEVAAHGGSSGHLLVPSETSLTGDWIRSKFNPNGNKGYLSFILKNSFPEFLIDCEYTILFRFRTPPVCELLNPVLDVQFSGFYKGNIKPKTYVDGDGTYRYYDFEVKIDHLDEKTSLSEFRLVTGFDVPSNFFLFLDNGLMISKRTSEEIIVDGVGDKLEDQTEQQKGFFEKLGDRIGGFFSGLADKIGGFFTDLFNNIMDGLKRLFIPSDEFIVTWVLDMQEWLKERFGALYYPIELTTRFINAFMSISGSEDISVTFPAIQVGDVTLLGEQHYSMSEATGFLGDIYQVYLYVADVIVIVGLVLLLSSKLQKILSK